jgi:hypothetical protein
MEMPLNAVMTTESCGNRDDDLIIQFAAVMDAIWAYGPDAHSTSEAVLQDAYLLKADDIRYELNERIRAGTCRPTYVSMDPYRGLHLMI